MSCLQFPITRNSLQPLVGGAESGLNTSLNLEVSLLIPLTNLTLDALLTTLFDGVLLEETFSSFCKPTTRWCSSIMGSDQTTSDQPLTQLLTPCTVGWHPASVSLDWWWLSSPSRMRGYAQRWKNGGLEHIPHVHQFWLWFFFGLGGYLPDCNRVALHNPNSVEAIRGR